MTLPANHELTPGARVWRSAAVHWLIGLALGLFVAALLVLTVSVAFPRLKEFSRDLGLAVSVAWERVGAVGKGGIERRSGEQFGYAFIDLDPLPARDGALSASPYVTACRANLPQGVAVSECDPRHPINRHLLAKVVERVAAQGAHRVVIDVLLERPPEGTDGSGEAALARAVSQLSTPVIYSAPVVEVLSSGQPGVSVAYLVPGEQPALPPSQARAAVPYPEADQPVRRYSRCFLEFGGERLIASLPFAAVQSLTGAVESDEACRRTQAPPRIVYTLPSLAGHAADLPDLYRPVLMRCAIQQLWDKNDACGFDASLKERIVVIGASHPLRRDRHFTPLGDMAGSEVVINAMRSFQLYPSVHEPSGWRKLGDKCLVVLCVSVLVWLPFYVFARWREEKRPRKSLKGAAWVFESTLRFVVFIMAMFAAVILSLWFAANGSATPDVDVLLPVVAVALEVVIEAAADARQAMERLLNRWFGLPDHSGEAKAS